MSRSIEPLLDNGAVQHTSTANPSTENDRDKLPPDSDLIQRPRTTAPPGVRIEGQGFNPLGSTKAARRATRAAATARTPPLPLRQAQTPADWREIRTGGPPDISPVTGPLSVAGQASCPRCRGLSETVQSPSRLSLTSGQPPPGKPPGERIREDGLDGICPAKEAYQSPSRFMTPGWPIVARRSHLVRQQPFIS
jgi:hypothetical protein